jgi:hypothetical protein
LITKDSNETRLARSRVSPRSDAAQAATGGEMQERLRYPRTRLDVPKRERDFDSQAHCTGKLLQLQDLCVSWQSGPAAGGTPASQLFVFGSAWRPPESGPRSKYNCSIVVQRKAESKCAIFLT